MMLIEILRKKLFWFFDYMTGKPVTKQFDGIINHFKRSDIQDLKVQHLLNHITQNTPYYHRFEDRSLLTDFPVVDKSIIRESFDAFLSTGFSGKKRIPVVTSGSTGTPFKTYQDARKKHRNYADTIYFAQLAGYEIGHCLIYLKIWAKEKMSHPLRYWMQNIVPVDVIQLNDDQIENLINKMESSKSTFGILGYASALELICQYLDRKGSGRINANVKSIISISEALNDYTRRSMRKYFGVPVVARYSNLENGIIAQQEVNGSDWYLVNTASYHLEILKMDIDEPAKPGELGRIVVTDLYNYAMPMIRYDTGDIGALETDPERPGLLFLSTVEGRKLDALYDTEGNLVSSYIAYKNMWQYTEIKQYQLIQVGEREYIFKINSDATFNREEQLTAEFKSFLGSDAIFKIEYVDDIPLLASGKRRKVVNLYRND